MRKIARERFSDWSFPEEAATPTADWTDSQIIWRGSLRRGRLCWNLANEAIDTLHIRTNLETPDWMVIISGEQKSSAESDETPEVPQVYWHHAPLRKDEIETILRYHVLLNNTDLREQYDDQIRIAGHAHSMAVEKIWNRIFLEDGKLNIQGFDYNFTDEARNSPSFSEIFSTMLEPLFEILFPGHPLFVQTLGMTEVSTLVNDLFSGTKQNLAEVQQLAEIFALPLGLVAKRGNYFTIETEEGIINLPLAREILSLVKLANEETVSLRTIYRHLKRPPVGLVREAQHLILTALVANRQIEFVTTRGDRINRRSLDLKIIWDDIEGIAKPSAELYPTERLTQWAKFSRGWILSVRSIWRKTAKRSAKLSKNGWPIGANPIYWINSMICPTKF